MASRTSGEVYKPNYCCRQIQGHFALSKSCNVHTPTRQLCGSSALILRLFEAFPRCNYKVDRHPENFLNGRGKILPGFLRVGSLV